MPWMDLLLRWMHMLAAIALAGGTTYIRFVLVPALSELPDETRREFVESLRRRWSRIVMAAIGFLLISGVINTLAAARFEFPQRFYHPVLGVKFLLAFVIFFIASVLAGRSPLATRFRQNLGFWSGLNVALAVIVICLAGALKFAERRPKPSTALAQPTAAAAENPAPGAGR